MLAEGDSAWSSEEVGGEGTLWQQAPAFEGPAGTTLSPRHGFAPLFCPLSRQSWQACSVISQHTSTPAQTSALNEAGSVPDQSGPRPWLGLQREQTCPGPHGQDPLSHLSPKEGSAYALPRAPH